MQRLKEVVRALPRVKLEHIQPDFNPTPEPLKRPSKKILKLYSKNSPIFLWDGSPLSSTVKPSIGAEHRFTKGYFLGTRGRKNGFLGERRVWGTQFQSPFEALPDNLFNLDERTNKIYEPITLFDIQRLIDLGRLDPNKIIDITAIINARLMTPADFLWSEDIMGLRLVSNGANQFKASVNIEFQMGDELAIAAVEKAGGRFTASYYDRGSIKAAINPVDYFLNGEPVRKRQLPPAHLIRFYSSPAVRGYLSDRDLISIHRAKTAQKYKYDLSSSLSKAMSIEKDPRQIWVGIEPGSLVNLHDKTVYMRSDEEIKAMLSN